MTVEVDKEFNEEQIGKLARIDDMACEITKHPKYNSMKGLIYVYEYDKDNIEDFRAGLQSNYNISAVQAAPFIKTKSEQARAFILTFKQDHLPYSIYMPGERSDTKVYKFNSKPLMCNHCMKYDHPKKWCKQEEAVCERWAESGYNADRCQSEELTCYHC